MILLCAVLLLWPPREAYAVENEDTLTEEEWKEALEEQWNLIDMAELEQFYASLQQQTIIDQPSFRAVVESILDGQTFGGAESIGQVAMNILRAQMPGVIAVFVQMMVLTILCAFLQRMHPDSSVHPFASYVIYIVAVSLLVAQMMHWAMVVRDTVTQLANLTGMLLPLMVTMLTMTGSVSISTMFQPSFSLFLGSVPAIATQWAMPVTLFAVAVGLVSCMSHHTKLDELGLLAGSTVKWSWAAVATVFTGLITLQGGAATALDGLSIRTAKFTINSLVPVVGSMFTDSMDTLIACSSLLRNGIGIAGLLMIASLCLVPAVQLLVAMLGMRLGAALLAPIADTKVPDMLKVCAMGLQLMLLSVLVVSLMAFLLVGILVSAGNAAIAMR